jgi:hypothetical protein
MSLTFLVLLVPMKPPDLKPGAGEDHAKCLGMSGICGEGLGVTVALDPEWYGSSGLRYAIGQPLPGCGGVDRFQGEQSAGLTIQPFLKSVVGGLVTVSITQSCHEHIIPQIHAFFVMSIVPWQSASSRFSLRFWPFL